MTHPSATILTSHCDQFRLLVDAVEDYALYMLDPAGKIASWNTGAERIKGYSAEEIIGSHFSQFFTAEDRESGKPHFVLSTAMALGKYKEEGYRVRKDGSRFWASVVVTPIIVDGVLQGFGKVTRDLTESLRAEQAILESHSQLEEKVRTRTASLEAACSELLRNKRRDEAIVNSISAVIWRWDLAGDNFITIPAWHEYTGLEETQVAGWNWIEAIHPEDKTRVEELFRKAIASDDHFSTECRIHRNTGEHRHFAVRGVPLRDDAGQAVEWVGICTDITDQKHLEAQLQHAQKIEAIGQFAGGIAHDFNNILTVILSHGELLLYSTVLNDKERMMLGEIVKAGERAASLTKQLLTFSRRSLIELKPVNVNQVVMEIEGMLRRMIGEDIDLRTILDPLAGLVYADVGQLGQVVMNLVLNSRDAMPGGGMLTIETKNVVLDQHFVNTHVEVERGQYVVLMVSDTGCGMSPEVRARVFEPFFTTKGLGKGTGLGLSVVHGIVKQFGGKIGAYSELGFGSVFKIYLPVITHKSREIEKLTNRKDRRIGTETILVVDDDLTISEIAEATLRRDGYTVFRASNGNEALQIAQTPDVVIDLLITDVVMPNMNGRELAEKMILIHPKLEVLYLSGYTDDAVVRHGLLRAQVNFLQKPFTPRGLAQKVQDLLER